MSAYMLGVTAGVTFGLIIFVCAWFWRRRKNPAWNKFDERQIVGRGKAFQAGFFTLLIAGAACAIWEYATGLPGESFLWHIGVLLLGITVFALTAIHYDAYVGMYDTPHRFMRMGILFIVAMTLSGLSNLLSDRPESRTMAFMNLAVAIIWVLIVAALQLHRKKAAMEDAE